MFAEAGGLSLTPQKTSEKQVRQSSRLASTLPKASDDSSDRKRLDLPEPEKGRGGSFIGGPELWCRTGAKQSLKAIHWLWDQHTVEKASTLFGGLWAAGLLMGSSVGRVMGALWARAGAGLSAGGGSSGESQGEEVEDEKEVTSLHGWIFASDIELLCCSIVSTEKSTRLMMGGNKCTTERRR